MWRSSLDWLLSEKKGNPMNLAELTLNNIREFGEYVSLVFEGREGDRTSPLICGASGGPIQVIGDARKIRELQETNFTCSTGRLTWRLLYRDDDVVCLFASEPQEVMGGRRPLTLVVPQDNKTVMVIN